MLTVIFHNLLVTYKSVTCSVIILLQKYSYNFILVLEIIRDFLTTLIVILAYSFTAKMVHLLLHKFCNVGLITMPEMLKCQRTAFSCACLATYVTLP